MLQAMQNLIKQYVDKIYMESISDRLFYMVLMQEGILKLIRI